MDRVYLSSGYAGNQATVTACRIALQNMGYEVIEYIKGQPYDDKLPLSCKAIVVSVPDRIQGNENDGFSFNVGKGQYSEANRTAGHITQYSYDGTFRLIKGAHHIPNGDVKISFGCIEVYNKTTDMILV